MEKKENKAYNHIFNDILGKVLQLSGDPSQFGEYLTQQIRELIGARTVVIAVQTETGQSKIFSVFPVRRTEWANQSAVISFAELSSDFETIQYFDVESCMQNIAALLHQLEINKAIAIPLIAADRKVGSILLLDIMDDFGMESVMELLTRLSGVFALVIRNSHLFQDMEDMVALRTDELQKRNMELKESEERWKRAISSSPVPIMIHDEDDQVLQLSAGWTKYSGYTIEDIPTLADWTEKAYGERSGLKKEYIDQLFNISQTEKNGEWIVTAKDGSKRIWDFQTTPLGKNLDGKRVLHSMAVDITQQKQGELELISAKEHAEESDRLKSAFLANMSHEIRTPMNGILGFAGLLKEPGLTGETQQEYIKIIEKSGARMLNIINDIVDISKIEAGLMKVDLKPSNMDEQVDYIYTFFKPEAELKGLQLSVKKPIAKHESKVLTDREKVYAILINLVKNAIKYTAKGSIEFGYDVVETLPETVLQFFVKDTGIGIPKERQQAVFDRFIQADITNKMARQGAGLGLSIARAYVEMLGGKIWVESEEGKGSSFYFTIPYHSKPIEKTVTEKQVSCQVVESPPRKLKILIVEDDETSGQFISIALQGISKEILDAKTGTEAIEICRNNPDIDLVLMDIQLPEMNGLDATRNIRQFNKNVVIIAQTAYALTGDREMALEAGCDNYISKPIKQARLMELIKQL